MNEISIELSQEEVTCLFAALGMTINISDTYRCSAKEIMKKVVKEQFTDDRRHFAFTLATGSEHTKG